MIPKKMKNWIDTARYQDLLSRWRFEPSGSPWFQGEVGKYFEEIMRKRRAEVGDAAATAASKDIGWNR